MVETHEFLADKSILKNRHDIINYQLLLLNQISYKRPFVLINNFNSLLIKRRIKMMIKQESKKYKQLKILFFLPVMLLLTITFATGAEPGAISYSKIGDEVVFQKPLKEGFVTSSYGMRIHPINKKKVLHRGIDIAAPKGTEVYAASPGIVSWTKNSKKAGKNILIQHADEYHTFYSQLDKILVEKGQIVNTGDVIGLVGSSGLSTAPHLHFEIRENGEAKDPGKFIDFSDFKRKR
jgi:murein DD-endopeptidase MepM/ murein hydrolase activator NlpD